MLRCTDCGAPVEKDDACRMAGDLYCEDCARLLKLRRCAGCGFYFEEVAVTDDGGLQFCKGCVAEGLHKGESDGK